MGFGFHHTLLGLTSTFFGREGKPNFEPAIISRVLERSQTNHRGEQRDEMLEFQHSAFSQKCLMLFYSLCLGLQGDEFRGNNVLIHDLTRPSSMIFNVAVHMS